jgi:hypothetical protein
MLLKTVFFAAVEPCMSSNLCIQTSSAAHPASCTMGTGGPFAGAEVLPVRDTDYLPPSSAKVEIE